jgi:DDB1- and CUL4-associated factor 1
LEIISSSEVWDIRTFHLLRTVPALDQCQVTFSSSGDIIYAVHLEEEGAKEEQMYDSSFKTLDASDYSSIVTFDVKRCIYGLCTNKYDTQIAVVENSREYNTPSESIVRLYDVGRLRDDEDLGSEAEEEEEEEDGRSDNSDDDELDLMEELAGVDDDDDDDDDEMDDVEVVDSDDSDVSGSSNLFSSDSSDDDDSDLDDDELFTLNADSNSS